MRRGRRDAVARWAGHAHPVPAPGGGGRRQLARPRDGGNRLDPDAPVHHGRLRGRGRCSLSGLRECICRIGAGPRVPVPGRLGAGDVRPPEGGARRHAVCRGAIACRGAARAVSLSGETSGRQPAAPRVRELLAGSRRGDQGPPRPRRRCRRLLPSSHRYRPQRLHAGRPASPPGLAGAWRRCPRRAPALCGIAPRTAAHPTRAGLRTVRGVQCPDAGDARPASRPAPVLGAKSPGSRRLDGPALDPREPDGGHGHRVRAGGRLRLPRARAAARRITRVAPRPWPRRARAVARDRALRRRGAEVGATRRDRRAARVRPDALPTSGR